MDGVAAELIRANSGFMAVRVEGGTHSIELSYATPWLKQGCLLSLAGAGVFALSAGGWVVFRTAFPKKERFLKEKRLYEKSADGESLSALLKEGAGKLSEKRGGQLLGRSVGKGLRKGVCVRSV